MAQALAAARPFLMASLFFGITYLATGYLGLEGIPHMAWKGAGVALLAFYAIRRLGVADAAPIAAVMAFGALGDIGVEIDLSLGAVAFFVGHLIAIVYYWGKRRESTSFSQKTFAVLLIPFTVFVSWALPADRAAAPGIAFYSLSLALMAAMAWTSNFPRYRVGVGALMFVVSDLFIFARIGPLSGSIIPDLVIWPLYYFGQVLICTGVVQTIYARKFNLDPT